MSMYPVNAPSVPINDRTIWDDLKDAGYILETPHQEPVQEEPQQEKKEQDQHSNDDDEMAETAARLLDSVADNTSEKFRQSTFLELMRRLRDREVRVEGDKMVEVSPSHFLLRPPLPAPLSPLPTSSNQPRHPQPPPAHARRGRLHHLRGIWLLPFGTFPLIFSPTSSRPTAPRSRRRRPRVSRRTSRTPIWVVTPSRPCTATNPTSVSSARSSRRKPHLALSSLSGRQQNSGQGLLGRFTWVCLIFRTKEMARGLDWWLTV